MAQIEVVVVGASAGGLQALTTIVREIPSNLCAAILVVVHTRAEGTSYLDRILSRESSVPVAFAEDGVAIRPGHIYVAPPDLHLTVRDRTIRLTHGPKENGFRPAVDPLFRTAARSFGPAVMGIVLSGALDDGSYGLKVVKDRGGVAVVQDPNEATHPEMPLNAMRAVAVDHVLDAAAIASLIMERCGAADGSEKGERRMARRKEPDPQLGEETDVEAMEADLGPPSGLTCPDCGGALWEINDGALTRYRCHVGHQYTTEGLDSGQSEAVEAALWSAVRVLEEHADLRKRMAHRAEDAGMAQVASGFHASAQNWQGQAHTIRELLFGQTSPDSAPPLPPAPRAKPRKAKKAKPNGRSR